MAARISELSPVGFREGHEGAGDFYFATVVGDLLKGHEAAGSTIASYKRCLEKGDRRYAVCDALVNRNQPAFDGLLSARQAEIDHDVQNNVFEDVTVLANREVYVDALALLRLAGSLGLATASSYPYCPATALGPMTKPFRE